MSSRSPAVARLAGAGPQPLCWSTGPSPGKKASTASITKAGPGGVTVRVRGARARFVRRSCRPCRGPWRATTQNGPFSNSRRPATPPMSWLTDVAKTPRRHSSRRPASTPHSDGRGLKCPARHGAVSEGEGPLTGQAVGEGDRDETTGRADTGADHGPGAGADEYYMRRLPIELRKELGCNFGWTCLTPEMRR